MSTAAPTSASPHTVRLIVAVPEGTPVVYLTGNLPELGPWDPSRLALSGEGAERSAVLTVPAGHVLEYKITLGSWDREGLGPSGTVLPNFTLTADRDREVRVAITDFKKDPADYIADWRGSGVLGTLVYWLDVPSEHLPDPRHVSIWLPPGYDTSGERRYPVLYMADGQNLFDPRIASGGVDWGVDEAMVDGVRRGALEPAVVVGVWNTSRRIQEYSPWMDAPLYARFLIDELMPRVERTFRVRTGPAHTFHMGSSMGGLLSLYFAWQHPEVFSACGCLSTHVTHDSDSEVPLLLAAIAAGATMPAGQRLLLDYGTEGLDVRYAEPHEAVRGWLLEQGLVEGRDFRVVAVPGAAHNEAAWRARVGEHLQWLLGGRCSR